MFACFFHFVRSVVLLRITFLTRPGPDSSQSDSRTDRKRKDHYLSVCSVLRFFCLRVVKLSAAYVGDNFCEHTLTCFTLSGFRVTVKNFRTFSCVLVKSHQFNSWRPTSSYLLVQDVYIYTVVMIKQCMCIIFEPVSLIWV